ncbi:MAG: XdhC family protein [Steroidobacteraceae bacterium]
MKLGVLERLLATVKSGSGAALVTHLNTGAQRMVSSDHDEGDLKLGAADMQAVRLAVERDECVTVETDSGTVFVEVLGKELRLILVGAAHIAQALAPLGQLAGYAVTIVDPRTAFGSPSRFPDTDLCNDWPDQAIAALRPDRRTAIVTLSHDSKIDDPALLAALRSDAFYVGALGSRRTHAKRVGRLLAAGVDPAAIDRIHAPVGLAIGAKTAAEIAISIVAEITAVLRGHRISPPSRGFQ